MGNIKKEPLNKGKPSNSNEEVGKFLLETSEKLRNLGLEDKRKHSHKPGKCKKGFKK